MARELAQILQELDAVYKPQKDQYTQAIQSTDPALAQEEAGLQAAKQDAFQGITDQANRRGLFYSGMPIAEQARYTGAQFLPALANLRARYAQQKFDLTNALNKVTQDQYNTAYGVRQKELDLEEQQRQFDAKLAAEQAAARASSGGGGSAGFSPTLGGGGGGGGAAPAAASAAASQNLLTGGKTTQDAFNAIQQLLRTGNTGLIQKTVAAIQSSAARGNTYDQYKLRILASNPGSAALINSSGGKGW